MSTYLYDRTSAYAVYAPELATFRNGDAKLEVGDIVTMDTMIGAANAGINELEYEDKLVAGGGYTVDLTLEKQKKPGRYTSTHYFQTAKLLQLIFSVTTAGAGDPYTHTISLRESQVPRNTGIHVQRANADAGENRIFDLLGFVPTEWSMNVQDGGICEQSIAGESAFVKTSAVDTITQPAYPTHRPFGWSHLTTTFNYGGAAVPCDVNGVSLAFTRDIEWTGVDSNKFPTAAYLKKYEMSLTLTVRPRDKTILDLNNTWYSDYTAGSIDVVLKFTRSANDYVEFTLNNLRAVPFEEKIPSDDEWFEEYELELVLGEDSTVAIEAKDSYAKAHYEVT